MITFIYFILALFSGIISGIITGLTPGLHINMIALIISSLFSNSQNIIFPLVFITSMSITHTFIDFIPSILLGSPDYDTSLSILPGHELLLKGRGYEAILYTLYGSLIGVIIILIVSPFSIIFLPKIYIYLKKSMFFILLFATIYLILREKNKILSFIIFTLSGFLGLSTLNLSINQPLLPLLTGLFGSSSLIISILKKQKIPPQKITNIKLRKKEIKRVVKVTSFISPICSFLPSLGSGQAAVISSDILGEKNKEEFLFLLGSINTIVVGLSFITFYSLKIKRTGSVAALSQIIITLTKIHLFIILITIFASGILSFYIGKKLAKILTQKITKINYKKLSFIVLIFITALVIGFSGFLGFFVFLVSTFLGLFTILSGSRRTLLMGCLMIPSLILYFP